MPSSPLWHVIPQFHQAPSSLQLFLGQSSTWIPILCHRIVSQSLRLHHEPSFLQLCLCPLLLQLHLCLPVPRLCLNHMSRQFHCGFPGLRCHPGSTSPQLHLSLHLQQLCLHRSSPWCHQGHLHGSSLPQLHHGPWTLGPHLAPPASGFFLTPPTIISTLVSPPVISIGLLPSACSVSSSFT